MTSVNYKTDEVNNQLQMNVCTKNSVYQVTVTILINTSTVNNCLEVFDLCTLRGLHTSSNT